MTGYIVISPDPRGFWHADYWAATDGETLEDINLSACPPDGFLTRKDQDEAAAAARSTWPEAAVIYADDDDPDD